MSQQSRLRVRESLAVPADAVTPMTASGERQDCAESSPGHAESKVIATLRAKVRELEHEVGHFQRLEQHALHALSSDHNFDAQLHRLRRQMDSLRQDMSAKDELIRELQQSLDAANNWPPPILPELSSIEEEEGTVMGISAHVLTEAELGEAGQPSSSQCYIASPRKEILAAEYSSPCRHAPPTPHLQHELLEARAREADLTENVALLQGRLEELRAELARKNVAEADARDALQRACCRADDAERDASKLRQELQAVQLQLRQRSSASQRAAPSLVEYERQQRDLRRSSSASSITSRDVRSLGNQRAQKAVASSLVFPVSSLSSTAETCGRTPSTASVQSTPWVQATPAAMGSMDPSPTIMTPASTSTPATRPSSAARRSRLRSGFSEVGPVHALVSGAPG
mmetsp:Transcript_56643/g.132923  ORF Transcript_56643/g.132923 Transcript_56643/m.132923 type:complete len:401 (+) Transcript_56643:69-1271(+)